MLTYVKAKLASYWKQSCFIDPSFLIIGAQKCGTTSLYRYLIQHPEVISASKKEVHYFDTNYKKGYEWYKRHFVLDKKADKGIDPITGEATPYYLLHPHSPARVHETLPHAKLIVMLRDPVERAYSHYKHHHDTYQVETLSFEKAIQAEPQRLAGEYEKMVNDENYNSYNLQMFSYLARGIYVDQIERWMHFFPKDQFLFLRSEDLFFDPQTHYRLVLKFLGLNDHDLASYKTYNASGRQPMPLQMREYLSTYFRVHNKRLYDYIGVKFD